MYLAVTIKTVKLILSAHMTQKSKNKAKMSIQVVLSQKCLYSLILAPWGTLSVT